ncbi:FAD/NAD(P)-binding domain-containing protein [Massarina eburnea CBS 473.64]|uniref:FAD/NAD(P)-binding domain-containing protein n=1 Tax=Massarina eburnea CBS 473.64 TaxID=1395130 RepID=A0A6A6RJ07_9PLEO|nr:FAD/NAD(P)-binding domain-containing protein [Massarina eburnea CBS 473.64]
MATKLTIIIVGAGLSGLSASIQCALSGHEVIVLEAAKELAEIGAGLQLTPNATRLLTSWGVYDLLPDPCEPSTCTVYDYTGRTLAHETRFGANCRRKYGAPFADVHRVDLQQALVRRAREVGVRVVLGARVVGLDLDGCVDEDDSGQGNDGKKKEKRKCAQITTLTNSTYTADLVVAADGLWSTCRSIFLGHIDPPLPTGDLAYRIVLRADQIVDEDLRDMVRTPGLRFWIGEDAHVVAYSLRGGDLLNVVLLVPDDLGEGVSKGVGDLGEMRKRFEGWDGVLTRLLHQVPTVTKWKLMHRPPLPTWLSRSSNLVLIGDACHPMLPYLAQGANSSIEDGAVLGLLLSPSSNPGFRSGDDLPDALALFERLRKERGERIARETWGQRRDFHLGDAERGERDSVFAAWLGRSEELENGGLGRGVGFPSRWTCPVAQRWLFGYDAVEEVRVAVGGGEK